MIAFDGENLGIGACRGTQQRRPIGARCESPILANAGAERRNVAVATAAEEAGNKDIAEGIRAAVLPASGSL